MTTTDAGRHLLGRDDEPRDSGAVVAVHYGDYRQQEIWVSSGANVGDWYPLGGEFWAVWDRKRMPAGVTKPHPKWSDVLARGPVTLLVPAGTAAYEAGWVAGRHDLAARIGEHAESLAYDGPGHAGASS